MPHIDAPTAIEYDQAHREASARQAEKILEAIALGDAPKARAISESMHAAAREYWESEAPELLNAPVSWTMA